MNALDEEVATFTQAALWTDSLVSGIPTEAWNGPGLGDWNMRALVGHTSRALLTVEQYLGRRAVEERVASAAEYYEQTGSSLAPNSGAILQRGVDAGAALGADPAAEFHAIVERVTELVDAAADQLIETLVGGMRLSNYLPTRTFELIVHGLDIAAAAQLPQRPPEGALHRALDLATSLAVRAGDGPRLLLALTGRGSLGAGYSVLPS